MRRIPRERHRRHGPAELDGGGLEGTWRQPRRAPPKLLDAIAALRADASAKAPPPDAPPAIDITAKDTAERRQVTVMFSDLVGSTALSARMDPEDLREVISAYQKCVAETVRRFGGFVAQIYGRRRARVLWLSAGP